MGAEDSVSINELPENMLAKITTEDCPVDGLEGMCWSWTGCLNSKGYGCVGFDKKVRLTHRVSYELHIGPIPDGLQIDHLCRNKRCCNPHHLEPVTAQVNNARAQFGKMSSGLKTRCKSGHPLAGPNVRIKSKGKAGKQRQCVVCEMDITARQIARKATGQREPSKSVAARHEAKRKHLLKAGEAALADEQREIEMIMDDDWSDRVLDEYFAQVERERGVA